MISGDAGPMVISPARLLCCELGMLERLGMRLGGGCCWTCQ